MGSRVGHVAPGAGFLIIGLWHLFNHIRLHALQGEAYVSPPWFPASKIKYLELFVIMAGCTASISMELFISPEAHQPFDTDGTIPSTHLHNFEHAFISLTFFVYAAFAIVLDRLRLKAAAGLTQFLGGVAFAQMLLLFHLHSADHMGPEGQYHLLLQFVILISLATTLLGIGFPKSFIISFVRSVSIVFQGVWLIVMGFMLWTPSLIPKGCFMHSEDDHNVVRCSGDETLHRAKSLVNIGFAWFIVLISVFSLSLYLGLVKIFGEKADQYFTIMTKDEEDEEEEEEAEDVEAQKSKIELSKSFVRMGGGKAFKPINMVR